MPCTPLQLCIVLTWRQQLWEPPLPKVCAGVEGSAPAVHHACSLLCSALSHWLQADLIPTALGYLGARCVSQHLLAHRSTAGQPSSKSTLPRPAQAVLLGSAQARVHHLYAQTAGLARSTQPLTGLLLRADGSANGLIMMSSNGMDVTLTNDTMRFSIIGGVLDMYFLLGPSPFDVTNQLTQIIGRPALPPYWSLGFMNSKCASHPRNAQSALMLQ